ncbi:Oleate hydroxylase FAH12 [Penicillium macrosclerotiorum]|uniref:Oleate hydroxylase FAH12 n=1 Tax=Penicillium macrosclerotiorum TaxID=303699 RepID=UPI002546E2BA|nr:Oleate hydroxylase FAH12 [Penicillium macrosclerotiorum]KAJ5689657.1 Oleate hydroxylase FAH12 [Penicillium macrosclerotiorum]
MGSITVEAVEPVTYRLKAEAEPQELTYGFLREKIPAHCFERSLTTSFAYLLRDCVYASALVWAALKIDLLPSPAMRACAWVLYTFFQGCVGTGLWIIGHECGHGAFSAFPLLNDIVGWAVHSALMVPYFSWKITHARHHRYHNNIEKDTVFVPPTEAEKEVQNQQPSLLGKIQELVEETPFYNSITLLGHQIFGWQLYLLFNVSAGTKSLPAKDTAPKKFRNSHFDPLGSLFTNAQTPLIAITDLGLLIVGSALYFFATKIGVWKVVLLYVVPYFWVHHWLVAITYLHHTHPSVPHYDAKTWTFVKGALSTVDRRFGFIGRHFFHEIIDYHVVHHLFPRIPFYHAEEATNAIVPFLGKQYHLDEGMFLKSLVDTFSTCKVVSDVNSDGVLHWKLPQETSKKQN